MEENSHYILETYYDTKIKTSEYSCLYYLSKKAIKKKHPEGDYIVLGAVGEGLSKILGDYIYENEEHRYYTLYYSKLKYKIDGYIHVGNNQYLAVIKKCFIKRVIYAFIILSLLVMSIFGIMYLTDDTIDSLARNYTPDIEVSTKTDPDHIALPGYKEVKVEAGTNIAFVALWNPPSNPCFFKFTIIEGDKQIYSSQLVPPGKAITEVKLNKKFEEGIYDIKIRIETFSLDKRSPMNSGEVQTQIVAIK